MSHVLVFLTIHGLGAPVGCFLASGALLYRRRLDQIVRFPMISELDEVLGTLRVTSSCIISVSDVSYQAHCQVVRVGWCSIAIQFLITYLCLRIFFSSALEFSRRRYYEVLLLLTTRQG